MADSVARPRSRAPLVGIAFALAVTAFAAGAPTPLYPTYAAQFGLSSTGLAGIFGVYAAGAIGTMVLVAPSADRYGRRPVLALGLALTALAALAFWSASSVAVLALARLLSGMGVGATTSTATSDMAALEPHGDPRHVARLAVAANFGAVAVGILSTAGFAAIRPSDAPDVYLVVLAAAVVGIALVTATRETVAHPHRFHGLSAQRISVPRGLRRPVLVASAGLAGSYAVYGFFASLAPSVLASLLSIVNIVAASAVIALFFGAAAGVQLVLTDPSRRELLLGLLVVLAGAIVFLAILPLEALAPFLVATVILGVGVGATFAGSTAFVNQHVPSKIRTEVLSAYFLIGYLALAVPTLGVGVAIDAVGPRVAGTSFGIVLAVAVAAIFALVRSVPTPGSATVR